MLTDTASVRIVDGDQRFHARGEGAARRLVEELLADTVLRGKQVMGYAHPSALVWTVVAEFESDGHRHARVFVFGLDGMLSSGSRTTACPDYWNVGRTSSQPPLFVLNVR